MPPRLGEILVKDGACTPDDVRSALKNQVIFGGRLGTNLLEIKAVKEEALARALGKQHAMACLFGDLQLDPGATALLKPEIADRWDAIPYVLADRRLAVLVVDPRDLAMLDEVAFATGKQIHPIVAPEARVWALLRATYGIDRHLRGIDVDFSRLGQEPRARAGAPAPTVKVGPDLMDERAFDALYASRAADADAVAPSPPRVGGEGGVSGPSDASPAGGSASDASSSAMPPLDDVIELTELVEPGPSQPPPATAAPAPPALAAEVLVALSATAGHAPPAHAAAPPREEPEPSPLTFDEAVRVLDGVEERDAIARAVLRYARSRFHRAVLLTVHHGGAHGWAGLGEKLGASAVRHLHVDLSTAGIVETVVRTRAHFLGPIPRTDANVRLLKSLAGGVPANALVVPILALGRVVNVFYADAGKGATLDPSGVGELLILATRISKSYESLVARVR